MNTLHHRRRPIMENRKRGAVDNTAPLPAVRVDSKPRSRRTPSSSDTGRGQQQLSLAASSLLQANQGIYDRSSDLSYTNQDSAKHAVMEVLARHGTTTNRSRSDSSSGSGSGGGCRASSEPTASKKKTAMNNVPSTTKKKKRRRDEEEEEDTHGKGQFAAAPPLPRAKKKIKRRSVGGIRHGNTAVATEEGDNEGDDHDGSSSDNAEGEEGAAEGEKHQEGGGAGERGEEGDSSSSNDDNHNEQVDEQDDMVRDNDPGSAGSHEGGPWRNRDGGGSEEGGDEEPPMVPASTEPIENYTDDDVLCGRGGGTNVHPGNRRFRDLINLNRRAYLKARKNDKPAISRSIVRTIRENNGRFLKKDEESGMWHEIGDDMAREKASQALRQRAPEMRRILYESERAAEAAAADAAALLAAQTQAQRQQQRQQQQQQRQQQQMMLMEQQMLAARRAAAVAAASGLHHPQAAAAAATGLPSSSSTSLHLLDQRQQSAVSASGAFGATSSSSAEVRRGSDLVGGLFGPSSSSSAGAPGATSGAYSNVAQQFMMMMNPVSPAAATSQHQQRSLLLPPLGAASRAGASGGVGSLDAGTDSPSATPATDPTMVTTAAMQAQARMRAHLLALQRENEILLRRALAAESGVGAIPGGSTGGLLPGAGGGDFYSAPPSVVPGEEGVGTGISTTHPSYCFNIPPNWMTRSGGGMGGSESGAASFSPPSASFLRQQHPNEGRGVNDDVFMGHPSQQHFRQPRFPPPPPPP